MHVFSCSCPTIDVLMLVVACYYYDYDFNTVINSNVELGVKRNLFSSTCFFQGILKETQMITEPAQTLNCYIFLSFPSWNFRIVHVCQCLET